MDALKQSLGRKKAGRLRSKARSATSAHRGRKRKVSVKKSRTLLKRWKRVRSMLFPQARVAVRAQMGWISLPLARDGETVAMYSKSGQNLSRYFPEVVAAALSMREKSFVLDGEIVVPLGGRFSFDDLLQRIHPAASRVKKLAEQTPALFLAFDLLKKGKTELADDLLIDAAFATRRLRAASFLERKPVSSFAGQPETEGRRTLACVGRRRERRRHRETSRSSISGRQPRRYAEDKVLS